MPTQSPTSSPRLLLATLALSMAGLLLGACGGATQEGQAFPQGEAAQAVREVHSDWRWSDDPQQVTPVGGAADSPQAGAQLGQPAGPEDAQTVQAGGEQAVGSGPESPVPACGPESSYDYVSRVFQCPGGGNPLGGDPRAGAASRVGNVGANSQGHVIDLYRVPCPGGPVDVYVDMYGCPEWEQRLH